MLTTKWRDRYIELADMIKTWSKDPRTQVGAVIVGRDSRDISLGYNGFPPGISDSEDRLADRELKNMLTQHAERNALDNAKFDTRGALLVTTRFPCHECAKSMVTLGIAQLICPHPPADPLWKKSSDVALLVLQEKGVAIEFYDPEE